MRIKFNPNNIYGEKCCNELGKNNQDVFSVIFCTVCNLFSLRKRFKISAFCKKFKWEKTCKTCQSKMN